MSKLKDMTGEVYGFLTVIQRAGSNGSGNALWKCKCKCGAETIQIGSKLRNGSVVSCGCKKKNDLTGKVFGNIHVIKQHGRTANGTITWFCKCSCGNELVIAGHHLTSDGQTTCGKCPKHEDLTAEKFGKLKPLKRVYKEEKTRTLWECQCDCGNIKIAATQDLRSGHVSSCGCLRSKGEAKIIQLLSANNYKYKKEHSFEDLISPASNKKLRFDFYVQDSWLIEYDGEQHFQTKGHGFFTEEALQSISQRDDLKNNYCLNHNIPLIRIPYTHLDILCIQDLDPKTSSFLIS